LSQRVYEALAKNFGATQEEATVFGPLLRDVRSVGERDSLDLFPLVYHLLRDGTARFGALPSVGTMPWLVHEENVVVSSFNQPKGARSEALLTVRSRPDWARPAGACAASSRAVSS
jgi:hypothetical protein